MTSRDEEPFQPLFRMCKPEDIWAISKTVGRGAFGYVHLASRVAPPHEQVAIKVIDCDVDTDGELESIRREVRILRDCDHANVVTFFASYRSLDMSMWIVMEYCGGGAVADLLKYRALDEDEAAYVLRETLRGLHHLHEQCKKHIIHRDLKSANLLLTTAGDVKVADFGVSKILDIAIAGRKTRSFVGTPHWMAPEVIMGKPYDARCDIWSVGIVGIEMAEQHPPKFNVNMHGVLAAIPKLPAPTLCSPQDHSTLFCNFLNHVLVKEPHQRPTAIEALAHCLVGGSSDGHGKRKDAADSGEESAARRIDLGKVKLTKMIAFVVAEKNAGRKPPRPRRRAVRQGGFGKSSSQYHSTNRSGNHFSRLTRGHSKASITFSTDTMTDENDAILGQWGTSSTTLASRKSGFMSSKKLRGTITQSFGRSNSAGHKQPFQSRDFNTACNKRHLSASDNISMTSSLNGSVSASDQQYYPPLKHSLRPQDTVILRKQAGPLAIVEEVDGDEDIDEEDKLEGKVEQMMGLATKARNVESALPIEAEGRSDDEWSSDDEDGEVELELGKEDCGCLKGNEDKGESMNEEWSNDASSDESEANEQDGEANVLPVSPCPAETAPPLPWGYLPSPSMLIFSEKEDKGNEPYESAEDSGKEHGSPAKTPIGEFASTVEEKPETDWNRMLFDEKEEEELLFGSTDSLIPRRKTILAGAGSPPRSPLIASENLRRRSRLSFRLQEQLCSGIFMERSNEQVDPDDSEMHSIASTHSTPEFGALTEDEEELKTRDRGQGNDAEEDVLVGGTKNADFILGLLRRRGMEEPAMRYLHTTELWKTSEVYC